MLASFLFASFVRSTQLARHTGYAKKNGKVVSLGEGHCKIKPRAIAALRVDRPFMVNGTYLKDNSNTQPLVDQDAVISLLPY